MSMISKIISDNEYKTLYERKIAIKGKYRFKSKNIFLDFIEKIINTINTEFLDSVRITVMTEFGIIRANCFPDFREIINGSDSIYNVNLEIFGKDANEIRVIVVDLLEFESIRNKSNIKLYGTNKVWISKAEEMIKENLALHKNSLSLISNKIIKTFLASFIVASIFGYYYPKNIDPIIFLVMLIYGLLLVFIIVTIEDVFFPTFKVNLKVSYIKRFIQKIKEDSFINIISILSLLIGIISLIISVFN
ncbi:hypothetical protein EHE19_014175 [Ruminiclostridium herbifermentans]|uniref:Uncharacterized protein n=1 Tax=Ruminiclostridium herbifermentans TaxID=2488810 RepID=A0A4U7JH72_9FIRM|nr:hypothetical protein [Ruminiclostridium herbifermentans]QNU66021.1 hypothetical protein EHE19_014175 [Ruminiclostridium herbifermentans]